MVDQYAVVSFRNCVCVTMSSSSILLYQFL